LAYAPRYPAHCGKTATESCRQRLNLIKFAGEIVSFTVRGAAFAATMSFTALGGGEATYKTVDGEALTEQQNGRRLEIIGAKCGKSFVTIAGVNRKNGATHVARTVPMPKRQNSR
jgi:hypothetical protein